MPQLVDISKDPFGLQGGTILQGGVTQSADAFCFYPVDNCLNVEIRFSNLTNTPLSLVTASAGIPIYGSITRVQMSAGSAILYSGSYYYPLP